MPTIETIFLDADTHNVIGQVVMPGEELPQSFAQSTTLHLGDEDWQVIKAEPLTAEEFFQTGKLVLTLRKIATMSTKDILYTLPSLCNEIPALLSGSTKQGKNVLELHEDDWRQIEFVSSLYRGVINAQLAEIERIYQEASVDAGRFLAFRKIYLRQQIPTPLPKGIGLDDLAAFFLFAPHWYDGLAYQQYEGLLEGGFAFKVAPLVFYGQQRDGLVNVLGVKIVRRNEEQGKELADAVQKWMSASDLLLVDWCKMQLIPANVEMLEAFFMR